MIDTKWVYFLVFGGGLQKKIYLQVICKFQFTGCGLGEERRRVGGPGKLGGCLLLLCMT